MLMLTVGRNLQIQNILDREAIPKSLVIDVNVKRRPQWCHTPKAWSIDVEEHMNSLSHFSLIIFLSSLNATDGSTFELESGLLTVSFSTTTTSDWNNSSDTT
ncbi:hypothetical protein TNCV_857131 [Trichonephila clavipes]|nr:hypothetical protein TNCV_857131 [Trichonephila clavipes]